MGFWRVLYRCGRIIGHFTEYTMVGYISSGSPIFKYGVSCELLRSSDTNGESIADVMSLPHVITNDLLRCGQTHSEPTRGVLRADTAGPAVARVGTKKLLSIVASSHGRSP